ncbi:MAG: WecB/TagA/CpsF family glycosyltransferase [Lachnospiraceae bacterium]|nr:WecB/TagA/CpsF family glycosyltransferase [Lachnospiraceae bacterium]
MIKKLEILGITLNNDTVAEAMVLVEEFLGSTMMNTIEAISMDTLVKTQEDDRLKECIEQLDLAVVSDKEILKAAGETSRQRIQETVNNDFFKEFAKRASGNGRNVFLLGETKEQLEALEEFLAENYSGIQIAGRFGLADCTGDYDMVINEINIAEPDVIMSVLASPRQEYFLQDNREKLNAKIWYGLGEVYSDKKVVSEVAGFARKLIQKGVMHSMISRYKRKEE